MNWRIFPHPALAHLVLGRRKNVADGRTIEDLLLIVERATAWTATGGTKHAR
jgi:hypothetical protein